MDPKRFDTWTRNRALRLSRRNAFKLAGATVAVAALPFRTPNIAAQATCSWTLRAESVGGPSAPISYDGTLEFAVGPAGELDGATFTPTGGAPVPVTGIAVDRSVDFKIALPSSQTLVLTGASDQPVAICQGGSGGILSGPQPGDLGGWQANAGAGTTPQASSSSSAPALGCPPPQSRCGPNCCPGGADCSDTANGICACPDGSIQCGLSCVQLCPEGQDFDLDSCACIPESSSGSSCLTDQIACFSGDECCSGNCANGVCVGCIDPGGSCTSSSQCCNDNGLGCVNGVCPQ